MKTTGLDWSIWATALLCLVACSGTQKMDKAVRDQADDAPVEFFNGEQCPDLIIRDLEVVQQSRKYATVAYTILNVGDTAIDLRGSNLKSDKDNLAVKLYFSRDDKLQLGDVLIGGFYLDKDLPPDGLLLPNAVYMSSIRINIKKQTSLTPYIIFDVDGWQDFQECDETNNQAAIKI